MSLIEIKDLHVNVNGEPILRGINLVIKGGEVHAIMGPNGSGKSTLSYVLAGRDGYEITKGSIAFMGQDIAALPPEARAHLGMFLAFQYPIEVAGITNMTLLKTSYDALRKARGEEAMNSAQFLRLVREKAAALQMNDDMLKRQLNVGFSGGEKKRNEILQMVVLEPRFAILDETDSGLDIDALQIVAEGVNAMRSPERAMLVITHYQRLLDFIRPDYVHVLVAGQLVESGDAALALKLEAEGYAAYQNV
ncbi:MAG: Fe-S cluster assembly ATPase SufC [Alphaproteobacteria bacterium]|nr:Fe-S cluster assembly ATPase SufC [Alphaproteobacteria bacterium]MBE8220775.1 Fe-S cluster assembly ATPase SufC [Alphaproteobacteria bacterium]